MTFDFHPEALEELDYAAGYYAEQAPGLQFRPPIPTTTVCWNWLLPLMWSAL
jgi:hypothetical protein